MSDHTEPREVLLVAGGTPAARWLAQALDTPEQRERMRESMQRLTDHMHITFQASAAAFARAAEALRPALAQLRESGLIPEEPPSDPRERALWARQHRGTGPDRQLQHQRRPRSIA